MMRRSLHRSLPHALTGAALALALVASSGFTPASATAVTDIPLLDDYDAESLANLPDVGGLAYLEQRYAPTDPCPPTGTGPGGPLFWGDDKPAQFRQGVPLPGQRVVKIVIMGDSYMSGEGAGDYFNKRGFLPEPMRFLPGPNGGRIPAVGHTEADYDTDFRHRSANAAVLQAIDLLRRANPEIFFDVRFNASSGASTEHFFAGQNDHGRVNPPQNGGLDDATDLVISGFGGNDIDFGPMLQAVLENKPADVSSIEARNAPLLNTTRTSAQEWADSEPPRPPFVRPLTQPSTLSARLVQLVRAMRVATSGKARIMMVNYPQGVADGRQPGGLMGWTVRNRPADWAKLRTLAPRLTASIKKAQQVLADNGIATDMLDIENALTGHELGTKAPYIRNVAWTPAPGGDSFNRTQQSGHPNQQGQKALAGHYALMIAGELGLRIKAPAGARPPARAADPCDAGPSDRHNLPATPTQSTSSGGITGPGGAGSTYTGPRSTMTYVNIDPPLPHEWPGTATEPKPTPTGSQPSPGPGTTDSTPQWNIYPVDSVQPTNPIIPIDLEQPLPYLWPTSGGGSHYEVKINVNQLMN